MNQFFDDDDGLNGEGQLEFDVTGQATVGEDCNLVGDESEKIDASEENPSVEDNLIIMNELLDIVNIGMMNISNNEV